MVKMGYHFKVLVLRKMNTNTVHGSHCSEVDQICSRLTWSIRNSDPLKLSG
jgi:hypothetical protein